MQNAQVPANLHILCSYLQVLWTSAICGALTDILSAAGEKISSVARKMQSASDILSAISAARSAGRGASCKMQHKPDILSEACTKKGDRPARRDSDHG